LKPRVLLIDFAPSPGGSVVSLYGLVRELQQSEYEPQVLLASCNPNVNRFRQLPVQVHTLDVRQGVGQTYAGPVEGLRRSSVAARLRHSHLLAPAWHSGGNIVRLWRRTLPWARRVRELASQESTRLIHCNDTLSVSQIGILAARQANLPCICHVRRFDQFGPFERWLAGSVQHIVFNSRATRQHLVDQGGTLLPLSVVHNGISLEEFSQQTEGQELRDELDIPADAPVVGILGRLVEWKGHSLYLQAMTQVKQIIPNVHGLIVGGPEVTNPRLGEELKAQATSLGIDQQVRFAGHRTDIAQVLASMDVLAHTSTAPEPFGRVLIEAMAMGLPVVASDAGGVPEIVIPGETGFLVPLGDAQGTASAILDLLKNPDHARKMGASGRRRVESHFTMQHHVNQITAIYRELLGDQ